MSPRTHVLAPFAVTQLRKSPSGACATLNSYPWQLVFSVLTPTIEGDRKYRGSYRRGEPQNTSRPHEVVPKT